MKILVDGDSCPVRARRVVMKAALRHNIPVIFAANRPIPGLFGNAVMEICAPDMNAADDKLVELAATGDIAVSRDLMLVQRLLEKGARALDDRGRVFTLENINEFLSIRDWTVSLVESGVPVARKSSYSNRDLKAFADSLNGILRQSHPQLPSGDTERGHPGAFQNLKNNRIYTKQHFYQ